MVYPFRFGTERSRFKNKGPNKNDPCLKVRVAPYFITKGAIKIAEKKTLGSAKRFGVRYGRTVKEKLYNVEKESRATYKCPYCHKIRVRKESIGIWLCAKCGAKFTGKAYSVPKKIMIKEEELPEEIRQELEVKETETEQEEDTEKGITYSDKKQEENQEIEESEE